MGPLGNRRGSNEGSAEPRGLREPSHRIAGLAGQLCDAGYGLGLRGTGPVDMAPAMKASGAKRPWRSCASR